MVKQAGNDARYAPNTTTWRKGQIVLHVYDQKHPKMFMEVIGYTRDGRCKTQYVDRRHKRTVWKNDIQFLLDPQNFGFNGSEDAHQYDSVRLWNFYHPVGRKVIVTLDDGSILKTKTRSVAWLISNHAGVLLEGITGAYILERVKACPGWKRGIL